MNYSIPESIYNFLDEEEKTALDWYIFEDLEATFTIEEEK